MHSFLLGRLVALSFLVVAQCDWICAADGSETHAVFRSTDRGQSWRRSDDGLPGDSRINAFSASGDVVFAGTDSGIFLSRDDGQHWESIDGVAKTSGRILCFATVGKTVYAGTDGRGLLKSTDNGLTWSRNVDGPSDKVRCLLGYQGALYVGTDVGVVFASADGGRTWDRLHAGLPDSAQIFAMAALKGKLFAGLYSNGLYAWNKELHRWDKTGRVSPLVLASISDTLVAGHNPGGVHWSNDLGKTWSKASANSSNLALDRFDQFEELADDAPVWEMASGDGLVFAGASAGIYYSEDQGRTWAQARHGLPTKSPGVSFLVKEELILVGTLIERSAPASDGR
jgi:photosystem II stability/assembly factor-like uncharacterized protein